MKLNEYFDKIYCINIDRRNDRWESCLKEFGKHQLIVERFSAIDGNVDNHNLGYPYDNELAGAVSHLNVIKKAKELGLKRILILEDDVIFHDDLNNLFGEYVKNIPRDCDAFLFGGNHVGGTLVINDKVRKVYRSYALHAYGVNQNSFEFIINYMEHKINKVIKEGKSIIKNSVAADFFMADTQQTLNWYCFYPHLAWQKEGFSDIQKNVVNYDFLK
jgi:glycosyl transferase family 25